MKVEEIVVISGKGGTGKTSLTASLVPFFPKVVIADCDVDAPDLHILLNPGIENSENFYGSNKAEIDLEKCIKCGICIKACRFDAIDNNFIVNKYKCEGCSVCSLLCKSDAVKLTKTKAGNIYQSVTEYGEMFHARLVPGEETSGKLVSEVRSRAKTYALASKIGTVLIDGSPGIACSVISSITSADKVVIVTEPSLSGLHDLERVYHLCKKFELNVLVVLNKYDLSLELSAQIENFCIQNGLILALKIPYNKNMLKAVNSRVIPSLYDKDFFNKIEFEKFTNLLKMEK